MTKRSMLLAAAGLIVGFCRAEPAAPGFKTVQAEGSGLTRQEAIYDALSQALTSVSGLSLVESKRIAMQASATSTETRGGAEQATSVSADALVKNTEVQTRGRIRSYTVISADKVGAAMWKAVVSAVIPGSYTLPGNPLPPGTRRRMVILPFHVTQSSVSIMGGTHSVAELAARLEEALNERMVRSRRFTVLDRRFDAAVQKELARLSDKNASADDVMRMGQQLATDYMVVGVLRLCDVPPMSTNPFTGKAVMADGPFIEIHYRVLLAPTGQLKWANAVTVPASALNAGGFSWEAIVASTVAYAGSRVSRDILSCILPIRVVDKIDKEVVLNQGDDLVEGDVLDVFEAGREIADTDTGESLGQTEKWIARIQVARVTPKLSYAAVVEGEFAAIPIDAIVRRVPEGPAAYEPDGAETPVKPAVGGGVIAPWGRKQ